DGTASGGRFSGVAPRAHVVSVKIAGRDGSADVSKVLAALQWVVSFKDDHGIRVLNLSLGTNSRVSPELDPLNLAVQRAWGAGIVVVVAASNRGPAPDTISKPADDPLVITVGAVDDRQTPATSDDRVPAFSGRGPTAHGLVKPDVVAPGGRVVGLRVPGSTVDELAPKGVVSTSYRRGSGTSMSAAVVSGLTALLLEARPEWTPDRVKHALMTSAVKVGARDPMLVGAGLVHGPAALDAPAGLANTAVDLVARGGGRLDQSRADVRVGERCPLTGGTCERKGETNANGTLHDPSGLTATWDGQSWYESQWVTPLGQSWYASEWLGQSWYGQSWYGSSWYGTQESTTDYGNGDVVPGSAWYGASG
ncbi:MAG TPA: S8 family serine peptidase, partial [Mycobacteriales bacterium]|nr:S8 family serine peptidase [Mycobacteriales bacterium]